MPENYIPPGRTGCIGLWSNVSALRASLLFAEGPVDKVFGRVHFPIAKQGSLHDACPDRRHCDTRLFRCRNNGISRASRACEMQRRITKV